MQIHHLSHIDLDGYGCQLVSYEFFSKNTNVYFYNANYGKEVLARLEQIFRNIKANITEEAWIIISDLNLSLSECQSLKESILELNLTGGKVKLELLDHHKSGQECANKYEWYYLDTKNCATKIVYETFLARFSLPDSTRLWLEPMVEMINSIDLWREEGYGFEFGKVAMRLIVECKELNRFMFENEDRTYKLALLKEASKFLNQERGHILLDNEILSLKKKFLKGSLMSDTLDNLASNFQVELLKKYLDKCHITCEEYQGFLSYSIGSISVLANLFLKQNPQFHFFLDVNAKGNVSLRANNACDVSVLAKKYFNGGGHANASGGKIEGFKESFLYEDIYENIQSILGEQHE
ncbi:3',5'-cyclic-nucleotide phosphodiesterase [Helicobacter apodemus]|uniref:3',5'-cyclic-nucleotide phosphodiesterase n=1 Tax=Helicobacter apodemus TaxID=135569 RepID=A0A4U8UIT7_9HELI|nr:DHHA1 domain-containing protein [Helicobacter apodemus]MDE6958488.1 3',5'-cyclic-nucleotide phosphodiesterase [Helicobacter apodemus]TLE17027.1 3',5'-cyclic-nucleotide phosphodiesterase [Helicobacter apodemus]